MGKKITVTVPEPGDVLNSLHSEYLRGRETILKQAAPISAGDLPELEKRLREAERVLSLQLVDRIKKRGKVIIVDHLQQGVDDCVATSMMNGLICVGEDYFSKDRKSRGKAFRDFFLQETVIPNSGSNMRSLNDVYRFINDDTYRQLEGLEGIYQFEPTNSLLKVVYSLYSDESVALVTSGMHCELAYTITGVGDDNIAVCMKDPLSDDVKEVPLDKFAYNYVYSPLGGLFLRKDRPYSAGEVMNMLDYIEREHFTEVSCSSGILKKLEKDGVSVSKR